MANVLSVISAISPNGGTITKLRALIKASKHNHFVYQPGYKNNRNDLLENFNWFEDNCITAYYGFYGRNIVSHALKINKIIKKHNIDIVHFYFNFEQSFAPLVKLLNPRVKMVRSIVGFDKRLPYYKRLLLDFSLRFVPSYIYISHYIKELYENDYPRLKKKDTSIIYNGPVNVKSFDIPVEQRKIVMTIGGTSKRKNSLTLIKAFDIIENEFKRKDISLFIIGDKEGEERSLCDKVINDDNLCSIEFVGFIENVAEYLSNCAIYVHPAVTEGFGIAVVEAMMMQCPCIVANKGALPELINDGVEGYVVGAYDARAWAERIVELFDCLEKRSEMGRNAHTRAEKYFSLKAFVNNHDNYYQRIVDYV